MKALLRLSLVSMVCLLLCNSMLYASTPFADGKRPLSTGGSHASIPLVYDKEHTVRPFPLTGNPSVQALPIRKLLPDVLTWSDGKGRVTRFKDWKRRRAEILRDLQCYEIGEKPVVTRSQVKASFHDNTLLVTVEVNGHCLELKARITYPPTGKAPYPLMIGTSNNSLPASIFTSRGIALMTFHEAQVNDYSQRGQSSGRGNYAFDRLYPSLSANGAYAEWAWGLSRLIDGLQLLGSDKTLIDTRHIGVTGCSYAGKMALFCGAMDERIALTIAQEPGGGGAAAWRVSRTLEQVEGLDQTDGNWFKQSFKQDFAGEGVCRLPFDHHSLMALCCPRALLILGNTDYRWLADPSAYVSCNAARQVWASFGIADRMGYSIVGGHRHCLLPETQIPEVVAFVEKFLLGREDTDTYVLRHPADYPELYDWRAWPEP